MTRASTLSLTLFAMIAFAANSVIGRMGLVETATGPAAFALIRMVSGAVVLAFLMLTGGQALRGSWAGATALSVYMVFFAYAYLTLPAGTGAIILFGVVQILMIGFGWRAGERLGRVQLVGAGLAVAALIWLVSPGIGAPPLLGAAAMAMSGIGWAVYSLIGRGSDNAGADTAGNFVRGVPLAALMIVPLVWLQPETMPDTSGVALAVLSGAVTSGLGYIVWYRALMGLTATRAGLAQLTVPALAALGGAAFLAEPITLRLLLASAIILGGVALATLTPSRAAAR